MERIGNTDQINLCLGIETSLRKWGVGYGKKDSLWLITPEYFQVSKRQLEQMSLTTRLFQDLMFGKDTKGIYLRGDFIPTVEGEMFLAEYNDTPVGEGEITALRYIYDSFVDFPIGYRWPSTDASAVVSQTLDKLYPNKTVGIVVPPRRTSYIKDYEILASNCRALGVSVKVIHPSESRDSLKQAGVIYRTFQKNDLEGWELGKYAHERVLDGKKEMFPGFPKTDSKQIMAEVFMKNAVDSRLKGLLPWTWEVNPENPPIFEGVKVSWEKVLTGDFPIPLVAKAISGREAKQMFFSEADNDFLKRSAREAWILRLKNILENYQSGEKWIMQEDLTKKVKKYSFPYLSQEVRHHFTGNVINPTHMAVKQNLGARICFTWVGSHWYDSQVAEIDVSLLDNRIVHTTSNSIHVPAVVEI
ncbi:hypothetical protein A2124_01145 [Candidatus Woesebacteria bacterium GWB1_37_5]|nr:MAG: hypothetical protein A2124_01145 [Candidatus Woesebacteria bacterium GWB1_37_5]